MRVAVMQPYFFPYIGYFQLMAACDVFLVFDDAQYIDRGWVNRTEFCSTAQRNGFGHHIHRFDSIDGDAVLRLDGERAAHQTTVLMPRLRAARVG